MRYFLSVVALSLCIRTAAQLEVFLNDSADRYTGREAPSILMDNGDVISMAFKHGELFGGYGFKHINSYGTIISSYQLPTDMDQYPELRHYPNGYMFLLTPDALTLGTSYMVFDHMDQLLQTKKVTRASDLLMNGAWYTSTASSGGDILILSHHYWVRGVIEVLRLNANGDLIWAANVGDPAFSSGDVPASVNTQFFGTTEIQVDSQDNAYILIEFAAKLLMMKLSSLGELLWVRELAQTTQSHYHPRWAMAIDHLDRLNIAMHRVNDMGGDVVFLTVTQSGQLYQADGYITGHLTDAGKAQLNLHNGKRYFSGYHSIVRSDTLGSSGILHLPQASTNDINLMFHSDTCIITASSHLLVADYSQEVLIKLQDGNFNSCFFTPQNVPFFDATGQYIITDLAGFSSFDVSDSYQIMAQSPGIQPRPIPTSQPLCPVINEIAEHEVVVEVVINSFVPAGAPILLKEGMNGAVVVYSSDGRPIARQRIEQNDVFHIDTSGWASGLYLLQMLNTKGKLIGISRVVIY